MGEILKAAGCDYGNGKCCRDCGKTGGSFYLN